jgi:hypothetical protein
VKLLVDQPAVGGLALDLVSLRHALGAEREAFVHVGAAAVVAVAEVGLHPPAVQRLHFQVTGGLALCQHHVVGGLHGHGGQTSHGPDQDPIRQIHAHPLAF